MQRACNRGLWGRKERKREDFDRENQLLTETRGGVTTSFTYDAAGNILTRTKGSVTDTYTYGNNDWKDLLTAYNGHAITYDTIGNPTAWYDGSTFTWSNGRQLTGITTGAGTNISYSYYADGRIISNSRVQYKIFVACETR